MPFNCSFVAVPQGGWISPWTLHWCSLLLQVVGLPWGYRCHCVYISPTFLYMVTLSVVYCAEAVQSVLSSSSEELVAYVCVYSVCPREKVRSVSSCDYIFEPFSLILYFFQFIFCFDSITKVLNFFNTHVYVSLYCQDSKVNKNVSLNAKQIISMAIYWKSLFVLFYVSSISLNPVPVREILDKMFGPIWGFPQIEHFVGCELDPIMCYTALYFPHLAL